MNQEDCGCKHHGHGQEGRMHHGGDCGCAGHGGESSRMHHGGGHECNCGCHQKEGMHHAPGAGRFERRRFFSKEEMVARLEEYLKQLQAETKAVEERLAELKKKEG